MPFRFSILYELSAVHSSPLSVTSLVTTNTLPTGAIGLPSHNLQNVMVDMSTFPTVPIYTFIQPGNKALLNGQALPLSIPLMAQPTGGALGVLQQARVSYDVQQHLMTSRGASLCLIVSLVLRPLPDFIS